MKIPDTIYLQWHGDSQVPEDEMSAPHLDEVTWCSDRVYDADIEYRRVQECVWTAEDIGDIDVFTASCGARVTPALGIQRYCHLCGGKIRVVDA